MREQVLKLTSRPSLREEDPMAQYQYLMNNGVKVAKEFNLRPGVALPIQKPHWMQAINSP